VLIQMVPRGDEASAIGVGFTATRRIGGAVVRNRAKRRLREAARVLLPLHGLPGHDYVVVARASVTTRPWLRLLDDVKTALISLAASPSQETGEDEPRSARKPRSPAPPRTA
jgi:ribonuclease P protein component